MSVEKTYVQLEAAHACLVGAVDELLTTDLAVVSCPDQLERAAELLLAVGRGDNLRHGRARIGSMLHNLAAQAETASQLLESAAASYMGRVFCNHVTDAGYTPEGAPHKLYCGLALTMEG